ncbi:predicted protein [Naegleria gruberi]|uniref:Predicted protein n=1 Tax=Naegleria gruberi TaxID=5762 RepID=D2VL85_NAEGR|nr:uncharacterized protein NAEGRDRAFT_69690 [Naegleria gruberi]EFC42341.1 predicted protein [Naegleria gruberi]|eukprot:XP_002675085.1 predicted protein [Naegleria gruberi strain NEG-M]
MSSINLFNTPQGPRPLVEFRAGKLTKEGSVVKADNRKGKIVLVAGSDEDPLVHFQWRDRSDKVIEDFILFPGDVTFSKVDKVKDGRVYLLKFTNGREAFYWMQEPSADKDAEYEKKINEYINEPPLGDDMADEDLLPTSSSQSATAPTSNTSSQSAVQLDQLTRIIQGINPTGAQPQSSSQSSSQGGSSQNESASLQEIMKSLQRGQKQSIGLDQILTSESLSEILKRNTSINNRDELFSNLPEGDNEKSTQNLLSHIRSPQFRQTLDVFGTALATGQLGGLMREFGLDPSVVDPMRGGGLLKFLDALAKKEEEKKPEDKMEDDKKE